MSAFSNRYDGSPISITVEGPDEPSQCMSGLQADRSGNIEDWRHNLSPTSSPDPSQHSFSLRQDDDLQQRFGSSPYAPEDFLGMMLADFLNDEQYHGASEDTITSSSSSSSLLFSPQSHQTDYLPPIASSDNFFSALSNLSLASPAHSDLRSLDDHSSLSSIPETGPATQLRRYSDTVNAPFAHHDFAAMVRGRSVPRLNIASAPGSRMPSPGGALVGAAALDESPFSPSPAPSPATSDLPLESPSVDYTVLQPSSSWDGTTFQKFHQYNAPGHELLIDQSYGFSNNEQQSSGPDFLDVPANPSNLHRRHTHSGPRPSRMPPSAPNTQHPSPQADPRQSFSHTNSLGVYLVPSLPQPPHQVSSNHNYSRSDDAVTVQRRRTLQGNMAASSTDMGRYGQAGRGRAPAGSWRKAVPPRQTSPYARSHEMSPTSPSSPHELNINAYLPDADEHGALVFRQEVTTEATRTASLKRRTNDAKYVCEVCPSDFTAMHNLKRHMKAHRGVKDFFCDWCPQSFTSKNDRDRHMTRSCKNKVPNDGPSEA